MSSLFAKRKQWPTCADRLTAIFDEAISEAKKQGLFEYLYYLDSRKDKSLKNGPQLVMLWWGTHPVGSGTSEDPNKLAVEGGAALTFSQGVNGSVLCVIYPFGSELHSAPEKNLVLRVFEKPCDVTTDVIFSALQSFFSYSIVTSIFGAPTSRDKLRVVWLRFKDRCRKAKKGKLFAKLLGSLGSAVLSLIKASHAAP